MPSRRDFMQSLVGAGAALPIFRETAMRHVARATNRLSSANPAAAAEDEAYWGEIQRAFDCDRTMINLNNGGYVCFSCGAKGADVITFAMAHAGYSFRDALVYLAENYT